MTTGPRLLGPDGVPVPTPNPVAQQQPAADGPVVPLDCDPQLATMLMKVTIQLAQADYLLWKMGTAAGMKGLAEVYEPHPVIGESKALLALFDFDALEFAGAPRRVRRQRRPRPKTIRGV